MIANADEFLSGFEGFQFERVTLTEAVAYIAAVNFRLGKTECFNPWKAANELVRAIQRGELHAHGDAGRRVSARVPVAAFALADPYPADDDYFVRYGSETSLRWRDGRAPHGEGDAIVEGARTIWGRIVVDKKEVTRLWPFDENKPPIAKGNPPTAITSGATSTDSTIRKKLSEAGKKSGAARRQRRPWVSHAADLIKAIVAEFPNFGRERIATEVSVRWKQDEDLLPGHQTLVDFVAELEGTRAILSREERMINLGKGNEQV